MYLELSTEEILYIQLFYYDNEHQAHIKQNWVENTIQESLKSKGEKDLKCKE